MKSINWPTPFYYEFVEDLNTFTSEPCYIEFNDGNELHGELTRFSPKEGILEILTANGDISRPKLSFVHHLHLAHPVHLTKKVSLLNESPAAAFEPS